MSSNNNKLNVPQAKQAMEQFKMQAASDVDGPVTSSYLLNYNRIIQNNSNQRLVSKSIVVHSIKNFISSSFSCYIRVDRSEPGHDALH